MPDPDFVELFVEPLNRLGLTYMVTGSVASMLYAEPRFTADIDLVLVLPLASIGALRAAFPPPAFYCPPAEVMEVEVARPLHGHVNVLHLDSALKADLYLVGQDPLHAWALPLRRRIAVEAQDVWVAPPEYVVLRKLLFFREGGSSKHLRDVRSLLAVRLPELDRPAIERWVERFGLEPEWRLVLPDAG